MCSDLQSTRTFRLRAGPPKRYFSMTPSEAQTFVLGTPLNFAGEADLNCARTFHRNFGGIP